MFKKIALLRAADDLILKTAVDRLNWRWQQRWAAGFGKKILKSLLDNQHHPFCDLQLLCIHFQIFKKLV